MSLPHVTTVFALCFLAGCATAAEPRGGAPGDDIMRSKVDVLGEASLKQPGGPSYEYFRNLMPPLRYVDASFRHYPITLSAPGSTSKARLVSNGSAINALQRSRTWINETGKPVTIFVGDKR